MTYGTALSALADPTRRAIFESLAGGPLSVGDLAAERPVSRPAVSQHLRVLKDAGLVCETRRGTRRIYAVEPAGLTALRAWLEQFWDDALVSYKEALEQSDEPD
jgi:DNA-binding transcriptional ArsR family regulator